MLIFLALRPFIRDLHSLTPSCLSDRDGRLFDMSHWDTAYEGVECHPYEGDLLFLLQAPALSLPRVPLGLRPLPLWFSQSAGPVRPPFRFCMLTSSLTWFSLLELFIPIL